MQIKIRIVKTNSFSRKKSCYKENIILAALATRTINRIAIACGFMQRKSGKITPKNLIVEFMLMISKRCNTYNDWAIEIGLLENKSISKQALNERMQPQTQQYIKQVVEKIICQQESSTFNKKTTGILSHFKSIKIDDSTTIRLPDELIEQYPGNVSCGEKKAQAKVHAMYNLSNNRFEFLKVHSFSNNDQSLSANVLPYLKKHDLCLRDLGFTTLDTLSKFIENEIYFIARKGFSTKLFEIENGDEINLLSELKRKKMIDREVLIGKVKQLKVRLIALPISATQAAARRRRALCDRDKRANHSKQYYELLGYSIYLTNVKTAQCNAEEIFKLYKLRWRIEIIFKSWKSCFSLEKIIHKQCRNRIRVNCIIYLMLLYIFLFQIVWWKHCDEKLTKQSSTKQLSILKLSSFFRKHFSDLIGTKINKQLFQQIHANCTYEKRINRINATEFFQNLAV